MAFINSCLCPWVCIYDFNFTTNDKEILGGNRSGESLAINYLKEFIFEFNAIDLGFSGIKRRLDKGIASISWHLAFPSAAMAHLGALKSNHTPILLDTNPKDSIAHRPFRFKAAWIRDSGCNSIMEKAWNVQARGSFVKILRERELGAGSISGTKPCARGLAIMHVMYTDDIILFSKATRNDAQRLANFLEKYCLWSGQSINKSKSGIFFSKHTGPRSRKAIKQIRDLKSLKKDAVYLGAPMFLSTSPSKDFKFLIDKV
nr:hypothetical protein CFP56_05430 [Quercus suber]